MDQSGKESVGGERNKFMPGGQERLDAGERLLEIEAPFPLCASRSPRAARRVSPEGERLLEIEAPFFLLPNSPSPPLTRPVLRAPRLKSLETRKSRLNWGG